MNDHILNILGLLNNKKKEIQEIIKSEKKIGNIHSTAYRKAKHQAPLILELIDEVIEYGKIHAE